VLTQPPTQLLVAEFLLLFFRQETRPHYPADMATDDSGPNLLVRGVAFLLVLGSPFRAEIEQLDSSALERAAAAVEEKLSVWEGKEAPLSAHVATAIR